jgi:hypothetical protein
MPRPRLPNLHREMTRHGKAVWYVREGKGQRVRIKAEFGTPEFKAEYQAALSGAGATVAPLKGGNGSLAWAMGLYRQSSAWGALSPATRRQRENIIVKVLDTAGTAPLSGITRSVIVAGRERRAKTPAAARHFIETMRHFLKWAVESELIPADPTQGVASPKKSAGGFAAWDDSDCAAFEARWPVGTRERVAFAILRWTGLRRGDAARLSRAHVRDGVARLATEKTDERVTIRLDDDLLSIIAAGPCGELNYIATIDRQPMTKESFGNLFRDACRAAGIFKSAHGLRKYAATQDANDGWSESELEAKYGWRGGRMASHYTRSMDRERLSLDASDRTKARTSIPAPGKKVRGARQKD